MPSTAKIDRPAAAAERRAERQRVILEAAVRAFARNGYHGCTVAKVAQEAGVADGTIYLYFEGKEALLVSAFRRVLEGMLARMDEEVALERDAEARLRRSLTLHLGFMEDDPELGAFLHFQLRQPDDAIRRDISVPLAEYARRIEAIFEEGKAAGLFRPDVGTRLLRRVYFGAVDETVTSWLLQPSRPPLRPKAGPLRDLLLRGALRP